MLSYDSDAGWRVLFPVVLPDFHTADFPADGFGELINKFDDTRVFVGSRHFLHMVLQLLDKLFFGACLVLFCQHNRSFYHLAADFIGHTGNGTFHYGWVGHQCTFHFERADAVTATFDNVVGAAHEPEVAVFVLPGYVSRVVNAVVPCLVGTVGIAVVFLEQSQRFAFVGTDYNLSLLTGFHRELHTEKEVRIETVLPAYKKSEVIKALLSAHPYEEPAFDLYPLQNSWTQAGAGVIGELETPETELEFLKRIKKTFEVGCLKHNKLTGREIQTVALCGGAGAFLMPLAIRNSADVFITGEIKYHDYFGHDTDILLAEIGHYESEQYTKEIFYTIIRELFPNLALQQCKVNTNPIKYL